MSCDVRSELSGDATMGRHPADVISLSFGLIFTLLGVVFSTGQIDAGDFLRVWALPVLMIGAGVVLAAVAVARYQRSRSRQEEVSGGAGRTHEGHP